MSTKTHKKSKTKSNIKIKYHVGSNAASKGKYSKPKDIRVNKQKRPLKKSSSNYNMRTFNTFHIG